MKYGIRSIPTLLVFKDGKVVDKQVGAVGKPVLKQKLEAQLA
jgi:thioredoxin 1